MWKQGWRDDAWARLSEPWDLVIVGGGITGAGMLAEARRVGLRAALFEAGDFSSGTSSRSSKLVHGGLRYLKQAQFHLTIESVREREALMREGGGLVSPLELYMTSFHGDRTSPWVFKLGLFLYDVIARKRDHRKMSAAETIAAVPSLRGSTLRLAYNYHDGQTDDSRLVLRTLQEATRRGAVALSYARVERLLRRADGRVAGVAVRDVGGRERTAEVQAKVVVNATGAWADALRADLGAAPKLRKIRGSHLVFSAARVPLPAGITMMHPRDGRAVFCVPWDGITLIGTTDVDHAGSLHDEPAISHGEIEYLLALAQHAFPTLELTERDVRATYAGVRPVIDTGAKNPTKESREHVLWNEQGLLTVAGGKLTTFRKMARDALKVLRRELSLSKPDGGPLYAPTPALDSLPALAALPSAVQARLLARYGPSALSIAAMQDAATPILDTETTFGELRHAATHEGVVHLEDLLLRRVRLGILAERGGQDALPRVRAVVQSALLWDDARWAAEEAAYRKTWTTHYAPPRD